MAHQVNSIDYGDYRYKVGDTIKCATSKEMVDLMMLLAKEGIDTDFLYEKDGEHGLWLEVRKVKE